MGGRKPYYIVAVIGKSAEAKKKIVDSIKTGSRKKITQTTIEEYSKSSQVVSDLSTIFDTFDFINKSLEKKYTSTEQSKKEASKFWAQYKKENKVRVTKDFNKILVDSLTKAITQRVKK